MQIPMVNQSTDYSSICTNGTNGNNRPFVFARFTLVNEMQSVGENSKTSNPLLATPLLGNEKHHQFQMKHIGVANYERKWSENASRTNTFRYFCPNEKDFLETLSCG